MKKASWGFPVSVFDSFGELPGLPGFDGSGVPGASGTKFEVGRTTSDDESAYLVSNPPMDIVSLICQKSNCVRQYLGQLASLLCFRSH